MIGTLTRVRTKEPFCFAVQEDNTGDEIDPRGALGRQILLRGQSCCIQVSLDESSQHERRLMLLYLLQVTTVIRDNASLLEVVLRHHHPACR